MIAFLKSEVLDIFWQENSFNDTLKFKFYNFMIFPFRVESNFSFVIHMPKT